MTDLKSLRTEAKAVHLRLYRWAEGAQTLPNGADSDGVADIEPWQNAEGENVTGEHGKLPGTFPMGDVGGPPAPAAGEALTVRIEEQLPVSVGRPSGWNTSRAELNETACTRIASDQPGRYSLLITNTDAVFPMYIGPHDNPSGCFRTIEAGKSYTAEHTAEVWAIGNGVVCEIDESYGAHA